MNVPLDVQFGNRGLDCQQAFPPDPCSGEIAGELQNALFGIAVKSIPLRSEMSAGNGVSSSMHGMILEELSLIDRIMALLSSCRTQFERLALADHRRINASKASSPVFSLPGMESPACSSHSSNQTSIPMRVRCAPMCRATGLSALL